MIFLKKGTTPGRHMASLTVKGYHKQTSSSYHMATVICGQLFGG